jgi:hypothetical protein
MKTIVATQKVALLLALVLVCGCFDDACVHAQQPGWSPVIIPTGAYRDQIKSMPIEQRPYRPLHFYGNAVRRNYYRGNAVQQPIVRQPIARQPVYVQPAPVQSFRPNWVPSNQNWVPNHQSFYSVQPSYPVQPRSIQTWPVYGR